MGQFDTLRGKVIMFDGPDYVGKSTQLDLAKKTLEGDGQSVFATRSNGGAPIGEALREVMLSDYERPAMTELHINLAQHYALAKLIKHEQAKGSVILIDRSPLSIIAYQVYGSGLNKTKGYQAADEIMALHKPELIICYQAPEKILTQRRRQKAHDTDFFETQPQAYFSRVAKGYNDAIKRYKPIVIDASGPIGEVHAATMRALAGSA